MVAGPGDTCADCKIGRLTIYALTHQHEPELIGRCRTGVVRVKARHLVQAAGAPSSLVYTLREGWAQRAVITPDGGRQILAVYLPGDVLSLDTLVVAGARSTSAIRAITDVTLCALLASELSEVLDSSPGQRRAVALELQRQSAWLERRLGDIGRRRAVGRLCRFVLDIEAILRARGFTDGRSFDFPLRQEDIGDALGLTAAHVNRTLHELRKRAVLDIREGKAHLIDRAEVERLAQSNECLRTLHSASPRMSR